MKAKCRKCGDTVEVTRLREYKSCKCGAIALDYGEPPYYYRVGGNPEDFDGEVEDAPSLNYNYSESRRDTNTISEEEKGFYKIRTRCFNCGTRFVARDEDEAHLYYDGNARPMLEIEKGIRLCDVACPICGCKTLVGGE